MSEALVAAAEAASAAILQLKVAGLEAWYGESHILHGVDFEVRSGEVVTLLGRNGAGKTTTLKSIMGIVGKRRGSAIFEGSETIALSSDRIARLGIALCPEERGIFASLNVEENLMLPPLVRRRAADAGDRAHPSHRREAADARRADRGPRARHHPADRAHHRRAEAGRIHHFACRTEFPLRLDRRRSLFRDGARPHHRFLRQ
jgi:ABC-type sugar transport system ATPase subunit